MVMDGAEEAKPEIPRCVIAENRSGRAWILGELPGQPGVDRRAELLEVLGLAAEDLRLGFRTQEPRT
jgi:hypothetical protein